MTETLVCRTCGEEKPLEEMMRSARASNGRMKRCKSCSIALRLAANRRYNASNAEKKRAYNREWRKTQTAADNRRRLLRKKYGLTPEAYEVMLSGQGGGCATCGATEGDTGRPLYVDHDHETGKIRGLLCGRCNRAVGLLRDDPDLAIEVAAYLSRNRETVAIARGDRF